MARSVTKVSGLQKAVGVWLKKHAAFTAAKEAFDSAAEALRGYAFDVHLRTEAQGQDARSLRLVGPASTEGVLVSYKSTGTKIKDRAVADRWRSILGPYSEAFLQEKTTLKVEGAMAQWIVDLLRAGVQRPDPSSPTGWSPIQLDLATREGDTSFEVATYPSKDFLEQRMRLRAHLTPDQLQACADIHRAHLYAPAIVPRKVTPLPAPAANPEQPSLPNVESPPPEAAAAPPAAPPPAPGANSAPLSGRMPAPPPPPPK